MKTLLMFAIAAALIAPPLASARDARPGFGAWVQEQGGRDLKKTQVPPQRGDNDQRGQQYNKGQKGRMTEEERRELHRDLERANREIYRRK